MAKAVFYITDRGYQTARAVGEHFKDADIIRFDSEAVKRAWTDGEQLIFIMAAGIVVRTIAPLLEDKKTDPPVVVIDEAGRHVISLLSGHIGGANELAMAIAEAIGAEPIITTASDVNALTPLDIWLRDNSLHIENPEVMPAVMTRFVNNGALRVFMDKSLSIAFPEDFLRVEPAYADVLITNKAVVSSCGCKVREQIYARPKNIFLGIGCNSGTAAEEIDGVVKRTLADNNLSFLSVASIATIDLKTTEPGMIDLARRHNLPLKGFVASDLNKVEGIEHSDFAQRATGANAVAEPSAILASQGGTLIVRKIRSGNVTVAVAEGSPVKTKKAALWVVGTGPGNIKYMTEQSKRALREADIIVGYDTYIEQILPLIQGKEVFSTGMTAERDRCAKAIELALSGASVALISGGDPGIYAMAGLVLELMHRAGIDHTAMDLQVIPGISALNACASRLGAPLMHDFTCISLSDRLTPWGLIEKRLDHAAQADLVIVLYNPKSKGRAEHIDAAREIIMRYREPSTPVGIVRAAMREGEESLITDLEEMLKHEIDMQTTVIVGNSQTFVWRNWMITPRGYIKREANG